MFWIVIWTAAYEKADLEVYPGNARIVPESVARIFSEVNDFRNTKAQQEETPAGHPLPSSLGEEFSYMFYVNHRRIE